VSEVGLGQVPASSDPDPRMAMNREVATLLATVLPGDQEELVERVAQIVCREVADCVRSRSCPRTAARSTHSVSTTADPGCWQSSRPSPSWPGSQRAG
jgi:hypothetical protein